MVHMLTQSTHCRACLPCSARLQLSAPISPVTAASSVPAHAPLKAASVCTPLESAQVSQRRYTCWHKVHTVGLAFHAPRVCSSARLSLQSRLPQLCQRMRPYRAVHEAQKLMSSCSSGASAPCYLRVRRCAALAPGCLPTSCCLVGSRSCTCTPCSKSQWVFVPRMLGLHCAC